MSIFRRVETLEAVLGRTNDDVCYKVVMLKEGESYEEGCGGKLGLLGGSPCIRTKIASERLSST